MHIFRNPATPITTPMTEDEFLAVLTKIVIKKRLGPERSPGYTKAAFVREGHWDGGPAFIRVISHLGEPIDERGPICEACRFLTGQDFSADKWREAAKSIGLPLKLATRIQDACELSKTRDPLLYRKLLIACGLPCGKDDNEDLCLEASRKS